MLKLFPRIKQTRRAATAPAPRTLAPQPRMRWYA
jgi:hypothetical protein